MDMEETTVKKAEKNPVLITISDDEMSAFLSLSLPAEGQEYTYKDVEEALEKNRITVGVRTDALEMLVREKSYCQEILAAEGIPPVNGKDGYFSFSFPTNFDNKPKILEDGSVDYNCLGEVAVVEQDSEIARYIPAIPGSNGLTVRGKVLIGQRGRELQPMKGKGFFLSEDKSVYFAAITGKAEYIEDNRRLMVSGLYVVNGDVSHATGNIQFAGDIHIKGNVVTGTFVKAYGHITVDGCVEAAHLIAGKDVTLKNGMQGGGKGLIEAAGNVSGKFFEQTVIRAKGYVHANAILNCDIISEDTVLVMGKKGIIVGGSVSAIREIEATMIGNLAEIRTKVTVGVGSDLYADLGTTSETMLKITEELRKIAEGIEKLDGLLAKDPRKELNEKKMQLLRAKIERDSNLATLESKKQELLKKMGKAASSKIIVRKSIYSGVLISINGISNLLTSQNYNSTYVKKGAELTFIPNI